MVRPVMYWSFAKRSMTSSMDLNMQGNPRARRLASERTVTYGLGQDNKVAPALAASVEGTAGAHVPALRITDCTGGFVFFWGWCGSARVASCRGLCPPLP